MQAWSWNILFLHKCAYAAIFAAFFAFAALPATNAATPAKAPAKGAAAAAKKAAAAPKKTPPATELKIPEPPASVGETKIVEPDKSKIPTPDKSKLVRSVKSFSERMKELNDKNKKKTKPVKLRKHVVDARVVAWGRDAESAENAALDSARRLVGGKGKFLVKDSVFYTDSSSKYICAVRINFSDQIPENWYMESEMATGFGRDYERAYSSAMMKAIGKAKNIRRKKEWGNAKATTELGVIPYDCTFSVIGKDKYCKLFFRYFMPR